MKDVHVCCKDEWECNEFGVVFFKSPMALEYSGRWHVRFGGHEQRGFATGAAQKPSGQLKPVLWEQNASSQTKAWKWLIHFHSRRARGTHVETGVMFDDEPAEDARIEVTLGPLSEHD